MKPELRIQCQCGDQKQADSKGWTKKRKRRLGLRFSSSKAQRRAKRSVLQENSGKEFGATTRTLRFECFGHQTSCPLHQIAGGESSETRTSKQDSEIRLGYSESCTPENEGGLLRLQEGPNEGGSFAISTSSSQSGPGNSAPQSQKEGGAYLKVERLIIENSPSEEMDREKSEAAMGSPESEETAQSSPDSQFAGPSVSIWIFSPLLF